MCSFELQPQNNMNSSRYINTEFHREVHGNKCNNSFNLNNSIKDNTNNNNYFGVEMNHFRIVKFIQESKNMLLKNNENNL